MDRVSSVSFWFAFALLAHATALQAFHEQWSRWRGSKSRRPIRPANLCTSHTRVVEVPIFQRATKRDDCKVDRCRRCRNNLHPWLVWTENRLLPKKREKVGYDRHHVVLDQGSGCPFNDVTLCSVAMAGNDAPSAFAAAIHTDGVSVPWGLGQHW